MLKLERCPNSMRDIVVSLSCLLSARGIEVDENVIRYIITTLLICPDSGFTNREDRETEEQTKLYNLLMKILLGKDSFDSAILKLQGYFVLEFGDRHTVVKHHEQLLNSRIEDLMKRIVESDPRNVADLNVLVRQIILVVALLTGLDDPSLEIVYEETRMALFSVFSDNDLFFFLSDTIEGKLKEIHHIVKLVSGIRLFNKSRHKGGETIRDLVPLLKGAVVALYQKVCQFLEAMELKVKKINAVIGECFFWDCDNKGKLSFVQPENLTEEEFKVGKKVLIFYLQLCNFLKYIMSDIKVTRNELNGIETDMTVLALKLKTIVKFRMAVPVQDVFPAFESLSNYWTHLQDLMVILSVENTITEGMAQMEKKFQITEPFASKMLEVKLDDGSADEDRSSIDLDLEEASDCAVEFFNEEDARGVKTEFCGIDPVYIIDGDGMPYQGDPQIGLVTYQGRHYAFKDTGSARKFSRNPSSYIKRVILFARKNYIYIDLLGVRSQVREIRTTSKVDISDPIRVDFKDEECQVAGHHPIETFFDEKYKWNEWDLKRDALKLANITHCRTKSSQTNKSHFRESAEAQTYPPRSQIVQCKNDAHTNVPTLSTFLYGLRGRRDECHHTIDLTRPLTESFCKYPVVRGKKKNGDETTVEKCDKNV